MFCRECQKATPLRLNFSTLSLCKTGPAPIHHKSDEIVNNVVYKKWASIQIERPG